MANGRSKIEINTMFSVLYKNPLLFTTIFNGSSCFYNNVPNAHDEGFLQQYHEPAFLSCKRLHLSPPGDDHTTKNFIKKLNSHNVMEITFYQVQSVRKSLLFCNYSLLHSARFSRQELDHCEQSSV